MIEASPVASMTAFASKYSAPFILSTIIPLQMFPSITGYVALLSKRIFTPFSKTNSSSVAENTVGEKYVEYLWFFGGFLPLPPHFSGRLSNPYLTDSFISSSAIP